MLTSPFSKNVTDDHSIIHDLQSYPLPLYVSASANFATSVPGIVLLQQYNAAKVIKNKEFGLFKDLFVFKISVYLLKKKISRKQKRKKSIQGDLLAEVSKAKTCEPSEFSENWGLLHMVIGMCWRCLNKVNGKRLIMKPNHSFRKTSTFSCVCELNFTISGFQS